jgi:LysM repeat protein
MNLWTAARCTLIMLLAGIVWTGCQPPASPLDEQKDPNFLRGQDLVLKRDYEGAVAAYERAVEVNPNSASAHFELGLLNEQQLNAPAAAVYHFEKFLKLRANSDRADLVRQKISGCKMELAKVYLIAPGAPSVQKEIDRLKTEIERLSAENNRLQKVVDAGPAAAASKPAPVAEVPVAPATPSNRAPVLVAAINPSDLTRARSTTAEAAPAPVKSAAAKTHTIKQGEFPTTIARQYGVKLEALLAANPGLDPKRLKIGQVLNIPVP